MSAIVVVTTVGTEEQANLVAEELVARRNSCCVNILPVHRSVYRWKGEICDDSEYMLVIKTLDEQYDKVEATIRELHSYELPEILAFDIAKGEATFLSWVSGCVGDSRSDAEEPVDASADPSSQPDA